jgi:lysophospholipase L1-like esterase
MKAVKMIGAAALVLFLTVNGFAQQKIKVACIGDSITIGAGASDLKTTSYPSVLARFLGEGYEVGNFGVSGRTLMSSGDRPYKNEAKYRQSLEFAPDIVVLKLGTNDTKPMNWDTHGVEFEGDLREMITTYKNLPSQPKVYVCYPLWVVNDNMTIRDAILVDHIIPAIYKVATELNVSIIDLHSPLFGMPQLIPDGVHPNDLGYVLVAKTVYDRIK